MDGGFAWRWAADCVLVVHGLFVLFVVAGGLLVARHPRLAWLHVPAAAWGAAIEFGGWICPLTPIEGWLRRRAGDAGHSGGFVEHYLLAALYPAGLTRDAQIGLGVAVLGVNALAYLWLLRRRRRERAPPGSPSR